MIVKYLILSDGGPEHKEDLNSLKTSWAKNLCSKDVLYLRGGNPRNSLDKEGNLDVAASIESILEKTKLGVGFALKHYDFDYLIRVNVSTYVRPTIVSKYLEKKSPAVAGFPIKINSKWTSTAGLDFFMSGAFLVFSRESCELLTLLECDTFESVPDDVALSIYFLSKGVKINSIPRNSLSESHIYRKKTHSRLKTSALSRAAKSRYEIIYKFETSSNELEKFKLLIGLYRNEWKLLRQNKESMFDWLRSLYVIFGGQKAYWIYRTKIRLGSTRKP